MDSFAVGPWRSPVEGVYSIVNKVLNREGLSKGTLMACPRSTRLGPRDSAWSPTRAYQGLPQPAVFPRGWSGAGLNLDSG